MGWGLLSLEGARRKGCSNCPSTVAACVGKSLGTADRATHVLVTEGWRKTGEAFLLGEATCRLRLTAGCEVSLPPDPSFHRGKWRFIHFYKHVLSTYSAPGTGDATASKPALTERHLCTGLLMSPAQDSPRLRVHFPDVDGGTGRSQVTPSNLCPPPSRALLPQAGRGTARPLAGVE